MKGCINNSNFKLRAEKSVGCNQWRN